MSLRARIPLNTFESNTSEMIGIPPRAGTTIALFLSNLQDWLPGVAGTDPRLGAGFLGGQFDKGGLLQPPFSLVLCGGGLLGKVSLPASVASKWLGLKGLDNLRPFFFSIVYYSLHITTAQHHSFHS